MPQKCVICGETRGYFHRNLIKLKTKYSGTSVCGLLERFIEHSLEDQHDNLADSATCQECYGKMNEYDAAHTKAKIIQNEMLDLLKNNDLGLVFVFDEKQFQEELQDHHEKPLDEISAAVAAAPLEIALAGEEQTKLYLSLKCGTCGIIFDDLIDAKNHSYQYKNHTLEEILPPIKRELVPAGDEYEEEYIGVDYTDAEFLESDAEGMSEKEADHSDAQRGGEQAAHSMAVECFFCDLTFESRTERKFHLDEEHSMIAENKCKLCGIVVKSRAALASHILKHTRRTELECEVCKKSFSVKATLQRHMAIHTRETAYQCHECGKRYIHYSSFYMHQLVHKNIRAKKCDICGYALRSSSHLKRHMRAHSGEKPYACPDCGQRFAQRYNMMSHLNTHRGISRSRNVFPCHLCDETFDRNVNRKKHLQSVHGTTVEPLKNASTDKKRKLAAVQKKVAVGPKKIERAVNP
ncbi:zinc finger protein 721-like [Anopheles cruzii]|uniref:zinc finger protein 721-like n=1 Tax=Anopheles cruzii TaxID=68878 RepID=UPI0022EC4EF7|nr:zinc finger protein 721-like [Anopheles cruzii]